MAFVLIINSCFAPANIGAARDWFESGKLKSELHFVRGYKTSQVSWHENGQKSEQWQLRLRRHGSVPSGSCLYGTQTKWYENGQESSEQTYNMKCGLEHDLSWYENGNRKAEESYTYLQKNPQFSFKHGVWTQWHANGQKASEVKYCFDQPNGYRTEWDENGEITSRKRHAIDYDTIPAGMGC